MTRNDYIKYVKIYGYMLLCVIPILVVLNIFLTGKMPQWLLIVVNAIVVIAGFCIAINIAEKRQERIKKKREEFVKSKK